MKKTSKRKPGFEFSSDILDLQPDKRLASFQRGLWFWAWVGAGLFPRVIFKKIKFSWKGLDLLTPVAEALGLVDGKNNEIVNIHYKRLALRGNVYMGIVLPLVLAIFLVMFAGIFYIISVMADDTFVNNHANFFITSFWIISLFALLIGFMIEFYLMRVVSLSLDRLFADTLCVRAALGVLVELASPRALDNPLRRRILLVYINDLARFTQLLHLTFSSQSEEQNERIRNRFRALEGYVREQGQMAIFSTEETLDILRENFMMLTRMFINGSYGDFKLQENIIQPVLEKPLSWAQMISKWLGRLVGVGLPVVGLYFLIARPGYFSNLPIDPNVLLTIGLAWLLLSVDSVLGLGVTAKIIATAKEFRELV